ncbi:MAG: endonuclease domain-containing protein, partial [Actinomycetota bacterium]|nr:endonuclease domain-containing protein [Actinomycetota bacterium]
IVHRVLRWESGALCRIGNLRVTTPARTVIDLGASLDAEGLRDLVDEALVTELCGIDRIRRQLERLGPRGRVGCGRLRHLLDEFDGRDLLPRSVLEMRYQEEAERTKLPPALLQHPVANEGKRYLIDFAYPEQMLAVELDGWRFHGGRAAWEADIERSNALVAWGWRVLRGTWRSLQDNPQLLIRRVGDVLSPRLSV